MAANPSIQLGTDGNWAIKEDNLLAYKKDGDRFFNKEFDFSRGSTATYVGRDGLIASAASGVPRIDFTNDTKGHLLLEPQRTNLITYSEDFSVSDWRKIGDSSVSVSSEESPDGSYATILSGATSETRNADVLQWNTGDILNTSTKYTFSVFVKSSTSTNVTLGLFDASTGANNKQDFTVNTNWQRVYLTATTGSATTFFNAYIGGTDSDIEIWGAQLEEGSYVTSYIPTTDATSTRNADLCNNSGSAQDFNDSEGVLFAEIAALANDGTGRKITLNNGSNSNVLVLEYTSTSNQIRVFLSNGVLQFNEYITLSDLRLNTKFAIKYKVNDFALWVNGFELASDNIGTTFSDGTLSKINFDDGSGFADFYGKTKAVAVFKEALTDAELEALTSYTSFTDMANELNLTIK